MSHPAEPLAKWLFENEGGLRGWIMGWQAAAPEERARWLRKAESHIRAVEQAGYTVLGPRHTPAVARLKDALTVQENRS